MKKNIFISLAVLILVLGLVSCPGTPEPDITTGLMAYYPFNGNAVDVSGNNFPTGVVTNAELVAQRDGDAAKAYYFNGNDARIEIARDQFTLTNELSVAFWVNIASTPSGLKFFIYCSDFGIGQNGNQILLSISIPDSNSATTPLTIERWHHITGTYDGETIRIYLNGSLMAAQTHSGIIADPNYQLTIGYSYINNTPYYWEGKIDDLRIYNRVLTDLDIQGLIDFND